MNMWEKGEVKKTSKRQKVRSLCQKATQRGGDVVSGERVWKGGDGRAAAAGTAGMLWWAARGGGERVWKEGGKSRGVVKNSPE